MLFSIKFWMGAALGAAAGYGVARALEAKALGHSFQWAFNPDNLLTPVSKLPSESRPTVTLPYRPGDPVTVTAALMPSGFTPELALELRNFPEGRNLPSIKPAAALGEYPYPSMPMWANGQVDISRNMRRYR